MNVINYKNERIGEIRKYSRMMGLEEDEPARERTPFKKFSLLKKCRLRESNNTGDVIRTKRKSSTLDYQCQEGFPVFQKFSLLRKVPLKEGNSTSYTRAYLEN